MGRSFLVSFNLHPAGQSEDDPVLAIHRHAVHQPGPKASVELSDELWQVLHGLNEPLDLPAQNHDLVDLLDDRIALWFIHAHIVQFFVTCRIPTRIRTAPKSRLGVSGSPRKIAPANIEHRVVSEPRDDSFTTGILPAA